MLMSCLRLRQRWAKAAWVGSHFQPGAGRRGAGEERGRARGQAAPMGALGWAHSQEPGQPRGVRM